MVWFQNGRGQRLQDGFGNLKGRILKVGFRLWDKNRTSNKLTVNMLDKMLYDIITCRSCFIVTIYELIISYECLYYDIIFKYRS